MTEFETNHPAGMGIIKICFAWVTYLGSVLGSISLPQWQSIVAIVGGIFVILFTALQIYILWRDKIVRYRAPGSATRSTDTTGPVPL